VETEKGLKNCIPLAKLEESLGFRSSFNFVAEDYEVPKEIFNYLKNHGFEIGVHGLHHDGNLFESKKKFRKHATRINQYLKEWGAGGFRTPSLYHNLDWIGGLDIQYDSSTFDTDPFEPQPDGVGTIFPFWVSGDHTQKGYIELPYTLPQDHSLFVIMGEKNIDIWKQKLDWIAQRGGMALLITHPDYMNLENNNPKSKEYSARYYEELLSYIKQKYDGQYWHVMPREMAKCWIENYTTKDDKLRFKEIYELKEEDQNARVSQKQTIWIDLDNSPHVPFFSPIISKLESLGYGVLLTARDCSQTCGLADRYSLQYKKIGKHYGKNKFMKVAGTVFRGLQLTEIVKKEKPILALSHGSRAQMFATYLLRIPSVVIMDYEHVKGFIRPSWVIIPEIVSLDSIKTDKHRILKYPGIKEDVYVPMFTSDPRIKDELGIKETDLIVTMRPPATEAHYHNRESERLFIESVNFIGLNDHVRMVILPRNDRQKTWIFDSWRDWCRNRKIIIPEKVVDGLNLLWHSDLVISGGGTMNREAAALGVPVYSIFRGKIGAVDRYLSDKGRLVLIENKDQLYSKIVLAHRDNKAYKPPNFNNLALQKIVSYIVNVIEGQSV
jgi:predicted glycosyltransferase/peptidoglycan/xylan/chitin deacetylase (PgdA/CDA1 family)